MDQEGGLIGKVEAEMWRSESMARQMHNGTAGGNGNRKHVSPVLLNLLRDTSEPILVYLSEQYGLHRVPGLKKPDLIARLLRHLPEDALKDLENGLIAAHYGGLSTDELLRRALQESTGNLGRAGRPRVEDVTPDAATLVEGSTRRWHYALHGYDVVIDLDRRCMGCSCQYFVFSSRRQALCKHLAAVLRLIPQAYAREALIEMLVTREYGGPDTPRWRFAPLKAA